MPGVDAQPLLPQPHADDPEDVAWALSTAEALWKRGEYADAVAWIRKAASAASEAEADMRVVELAKAAVELSSLVESFGAPAEKVAAPPAPPAPPPPPPPPATDGEITATSPVPSSDVALDIELEEVVSVSNPNLVAAPPAREPREQPSARPPGPPPRPPAPKREPSPRLPTPNALPSPIREMALTPEVTRAAIAVTEDPLAPPPPLPQTRATAGTDEHDSLTSMPSVPPEPPDFAPTPMAMRAAPSVMPGPLDESPSRPPPPMAQQPAGPAPPPKPMVISSRTATAPFGFPARQPELTPSLAEAAVGMRPAKVPAFEEEEKPVEGVDAIEVPQRPGVPASPIPPKLEIEETRPSDRPTVPRKALDLDFGHGSRITSPSQRPPPPASKSNPIRPPSRPPPPMPNAGSGAAMRRAATPPLGSVPPPAAPRISLRPSAVPETTGEEGLQKHLSDAPPRTAQSEASIPIPPAPKPPSVAPAPRIATLGGFLDTPPPTSTSSPPSAREVVLDPDRFEVLADVPDDARESLVRTAEKVVLLPEETATAPALAIVLQGELEVRARGFLTRLDAIAANQVRLLAPIAPADHQLQVIGGSKGARYLALGIEAVEALRSAAPWVVQELEPASDDVHVVGGALRGPLGARLDGSLLGMVLARSKTMRLGPDAKVVKNGEAVRALIVVGAGSLSLRSGEALDAEEIGTLSPGEILFPGELIGRLPAPSTVRAGKNGALVIVATRAATEELLVTVPPLLELLGE